MPHLTRRNPTWPRPPRDLLCAVAEELLTIEPLARVVGEELHLISGIREAMAVVTLPSPGVVRVHTWRLPDEVDRGMVILALETILADRGAPDYRSLRQIERRNITHLLEKPAELHERDSASVVQDICTAIWDTLNEAVEAYRQTTLLARVPHLSLSSSGGAAPFQAEGTWLGYNFYFRYRGGHVQLRVGEDAVGNALWEASTDYRDAYGGSLTSDEFVRLFCELAAQLATAQTRFEFPFDAPHPTSTDPWHASRVGWGHTVEEAYADAVYRISLTSSTFPETRRLLSTPLREDGRVFPSVMPRFRVLPTAQ